MDVILVEPEKAARKAVIDGDLSSLQKTVGGYIQAIYPYEDPVAIVCNEEGKLAGLPLNRRLEDYDIIAGTFLICGLGEEDFASLSPELADKYLEKFADPEVFMRIGNRIAAIPFKPREDGKAMEPRTTSAGMEL